MTSVDQCLELLSALRLKKAKALLVYLLFTPNQFHRNEKIIDLLWQGDDAGKTGASLRQAVRQARIALEPLGSISIETRAGQIAARAAPGWSLEQALAEGLATERWSPEAARSARLFLAELEALVGISSSLDSWLAISMTRCTTVVREVLESRIARARDSPDAREAAEFVLEQDPANENAVRYLMRMYWNARAPTRAIDLYNALYRHLDETYDQEPEAETVSLLAAIKMDPAGEILAPVRDRSEQRVTLAVAEIVDAGLDRQQVSLSAVLAADFRMRLSRFREWTVVEPAPDQQPYVTVRLKLLSYAGRQDFLVEVTRGRQGELLWSDIIHSPTEQWERKLRPALMNIANALSVVVADRSPTDAGAAIYDRWLRSQVLLDAWSPDTEGEALAMLRGITHEAPRFGPAHSELAGALNVRHVLLPGTRQTEDVKQSALHHALEAVSIDPLDTRAHRVLAWCYCHKREFELADFHFDQALVLNRQNPLTVASAALGFAFTGNLDQARELVREVRSNAATIEPFHLVYLGAVDYLCGDFETAADQCARAAGLMSTVGGWHTAALQKLGQHDRARERLAAYVDEIRPLWRGDAPADEAAIIAWFGSVFPLRHKVVGEDLRATLAAVSRGPPLDQSSVRGGGR